MPLGQSQCIPQADPGGGATPRFWHRLIRFRHVISGSLALASLNHTCRNLVPTFPQRSPPSLSTTAACGGLRSTPDCRPRRTFLHLSYSYAVWTGDTRDTRPEPVMCSAPAGRGASSTAGEQKDIHRLVVEVPVLTQPADHRVDIRRGGAKLLELPLIQDESRTPTEGGNLVAPGLSDVCLGRLGVEARTSTGLRTSSAAIAGSRSGWPSAQRYSMVTVWPPTNPFSANPRRNTGTRCAVSSGDLALR